MTAPTADMLLAALKPRARLFVQAYFACNLNATAAARQIAPKAKRPDQLGYEYLRKPEIARAIQAVMAEHAMPASEVLTRLSMQARGSMEQFVRADEEEVTLTWSLLRLPSKNDSEEGDGEADDGDEEGTILRLAMSDRVKPTDRVLRTETVKRTAVRIDLVAAAERGHLNLIKRFSIDQNDRITIELYDAQAALLALGRHYKLFVDRTEVTGRDGQPIEITDARQRLLERLTRRAANADADAAPGGAGGSR